MDDSNAPLYAVRYPGRPGPANYLKVKRTGIDRAARLDQATKAPFDRAERFAEQHPDPDGGPVEVILCSEARDQEARK